MDPSHKCVRRLLYSGFGSTADDTTYTLVLFLWPAIPRKCELVISRKDSVLSHVPVVLISCACVCVWGGVHAKVTSTVICTGLVV